MSILFFVLLMGLNFGISWMNARGAGKVWSESKEIGGMLRVNAWIGYLMAIFGFTMVYGVILAMALPYILPLFIENMSQDVLWSATQLASDMIYILVAAFIVPVGFFVWFQNLVSFWHRRTLSEGLRLGWNTYAQIKNTVSVARNAPSAMGRIITALFGGKGKKKGNAVVVMLAVFVVIIAVCGGYFTASSILKRADAEFDLFDGLQPADSMA